jgi:hypothetical protein
VHKGVPRTSQPWFPAGRALIIFNLCAGIACLLRTGIPTTSGQAFLRNQAPENLRPALTFADRVEYQYAIEEAYWRHRIWPKENPVPKPQLDASVSQREIKRKVEDYLRKSQFVTELRGSPITSHELQAEMERMASHTNEPDVLRELFAALGNDPFVIAECLARPMLAERLASELAKHTGIKESVSNAQALAVESAPRSRAYRIPEIADDCSDDSWAAMGTAGVPDARFHHTAIWTGSEMIVWGGSNPIRLNTGGRYDPSTDSWAATSLVNAPVPRTLHSAVWTGNEMIVWGGEGNGSPREVNTGGRYNPITDSWVAISTANAPNAREQHTAVWTGTDMIVWGGADDTSWFNTGGRYNPSTDSWAATSTINTPEARWAHTAVWMGGEMIVWGGTNQTNYLNTGGRYNPSTDNWTPTGLTNVPLGRVAYTAVWTGNEMIAWGGVDSTFNFSNTGGRYNPSTDDWIATSLANAPPPRGSHSAVWTGSQMIIWGGYYYPPGIFLNTGGRYSPLSNSWTPTATTNAPLARENHTAVWTGDEMVVWGGFNGDNPPYYLNTGGRYCAQSGPPPSPTPTATTSPTPTPTATPTSTVTASPSPTPSATATPAPRVTPTPRARPNPRPRP